MAEKSFIDKFKVFFDEANGGKPLTPGALLRAIQATNPNVKLTEQEVIDIFYEIDSNRDREISWEEFEAAMTAKSPKEITKAEIQSFLESADTDRSGKLNRDEVKKLLQINCLKISEEALDELIDNADHNKDGEISYQEVLDAWYAGI